MGSPGDAPAAGVQDPPPGSGLPPSWRSALVFTSAFPSSVHPMNGVFVKERLRHVAALPGRSLRIVSPIPYFPRIPLSRKYYAFAITPRREQIAGLDVVRPRYPILPSIGAALQGPSMFWFSRAAVMRVRREFPFDLIDSHFIYPDGYAAVRMAKLLGVPVVLTGRGSDLRIMGYDARVGPLVRWALKEASALIAVSQELAGHMKSLSGREDVAVIPNGVDAEKFRPLAKETARSRIELAGKPLLLSAGYMLEIKGFNLLIDAVDILRRRWPEIHLAILGGPARWGKDVTPELIAQRERLGLSRHVTIAGYRPQDDLDAWYSAADLFCLVSSTEGFPNVLLEALACGTPAIGTRVGGIPEILDDDRLGLLADERTPEGIARTIASALERRWDAAEIRARLETRSWAAAALSIDRVFERAIRSTSTRRSP